jgi:NAD(P)-dependent dehydrogenase (short-subunit alcohol dehydrogenase family)
MHDLDGLGYRAKTVVVTGGSSGMGEAAARILGQLGAKVHIVDIQQPKVACEAFYKTDLSDPDQVSATSKALRDIGLIHFLFPCAGIPPHALGPLKCMLVNYVGNRQFIEEVLPAMEDGGSIAIISSDACLSWQKNLPQHLELLAISDPRAARRWCEANPDKLRDGYTTSKEMLVVWVQHFAVKLGMERRIRLNTIAPCPTKTAFMEESVKVLGQEFLDNFPYPVLHRMATAEEQAWPLLLLNSPLNAAVTGAVLYTDQGFVGGLFTGAINSSVMSPGNRRTPA